MEWIGTGFVLTVGGVRLRVRIALEDTPDDRARDAIRLDAGASADGPAFGEPATRPRVHTPRSR
jgi:hypothetical protein